MSGFITFDYGCDACGFCEPEVVKRGEVPDSIPCNQADCPGTRHKRLGFPVNLRASYHDGNRRFQGLREQRERQKEERHKQRERAKKALKDLGGSR